MEELEIEKRMITFYSKQNNMVPLHAAYGHFATSHSHINYYIDLTSLKTRISEARECARILERSYRGVAMYVDTIVCMDGTETIGTFLAQEFMDRGYMTMNKHNTIYVVTPEYNRNNQLMFRDNIAATIKGKNVILLMATTTTGQTVRRSMECIEYYQGKVVGIDSLFSTIDQIDNNTIHHIFSQDDLPGYGAFDSRECPFCQKKKPIEAMVNGFGYSKYMAF